MKLDYIVLPSERVMKLREWYCEYFELGVDWENDDFVLLPGDNGARLGTHRGPPLMDSEQIRLHFEVDNVEETYEKLRDAAVEFSASTVVTAWGHRTAVCHDPGGHTVEVFSPMDS